MNNSIQCLSLCKDFTGDGVEINAIDDVNLNLSEGELISISGSSGSGKSTLLSLIDTLDTPTSGTIMYGNQIVKDQRSLSDA